MFNIIELKNTLRACWSVSPISAAMHKDIAKLAVKIIITAII